ncbi:MAG: hypothetical protein LBJ47_09920 [Tannerella sp.]|jgi:hypothetical protein|nr:hypothetical protein [Tannerella sp.]
MIKQLYLDIKTRLQSVVDADGNRVFRHFDMWNRQPQFTQEQTGFDFPAIFVEFTPMVWSTLGNRVQECELNVRLHIVTEWHADTADYSPTEQRALEFLDIADRMVCALQNFATPYMNSWMRSRSIIDHDHDTLVNNIEEYRCNLRDTGAVKKRVPVQAQFKLIESKTL